MKTPEQIGRQNSSNAQGRTRAALQMLASAQKRIAQLEQQVANGTDETNHAYSRWLRACLSKDSMERQLSYAKARWTAANRRANYWRGVALSAMDKEAAR